MADIQKTVDTIKSLKTSDFLDGWVRNVLDQDFTDIEELPLPIEDEIQNCNYHLENLTAVKKVLKPWVDGKLGKDGEGFWTIVVEGDLSHKRILCLLHYIMTLGQKRLANTKQKLAGIIAADVYYTMVTIPGSGAFKVFHPVLFQKACESFKMWKNLGAPKRKRNSSPIRQSQSSQRSKRGKRSRNSQPDEDSVLSGEENSGDEEPTVTPQDLTKLNTALFKLLQGFVNLIKTYSLREAEDSAYQSLQILAELSRLEVETFDGDFDENIAIDDLRTVPEVAYRGLSLISTNAHGDVTAMINNVLKHLLPSVLMFIGENKAVAAQTIPRSIVMVKDQAVSFICHLLKSRPEVGASVRILLQHMCTKLADKSEYRAKVAHAVVTIMKQLPTEAYARMIEWFYKFGRHNKIAYRGFALDLAGMLIQEPERTDGHGDLAVFLTHGFLLQMILSRCSDTAPTVRARAIVGFANCASSVKPSIMKTVKDMMTPMVDGAVTRPPKSRIRISGDGLPITENRVEQSPLPSINSTGSHANTIASARPSMETAGEGSTITNAMPSMDMASELQGGSNRSSIESALATLQGLPRDIGRPSPLVTVQLTPGVEITLTDGQGVVSMLRRRARDEKVNVRKASLQALENLVRMDKEAFNDKDMEILNERCRDPALSVRKQAMQCLYDLLLEMPRSKKIQKVFLHGVLPMIIDRETTAQDKAIEIIGDVLMGNIVPFTRCVEDEHHMAWELLDLIAGNDGVELRRFLAKGCQHWGKTGQFRKDLISALKTHVGTPHNNGVWMLLSEVSKYVAKFDVNFVLDYWNGTAKLAPASEFGTVQRVLVVLQQVAKNIDEEQVSSVTADLKSRLMKFDLPSEIISAAVTTLNKLCQALTGDREVAERMTKEWFVDLLKACDTFLSEVILNENQDAEFDEDKVICYLYTLGEIAQLCPDKTPRRVFMLVQSLIASPVITTVDGSSQPMSESSQGDKAVADSSESEKGNDQTSSSQPASQSQPGTWPALSQGSQASQPLSQFRGSRMSTRIRAHAFVTLGKLCLQNEDIAKKCVAAMARELEICTDPAVRNNVVIIMCDLCVRYTTLVDRYLNNISSCLKDDSVLVRKQTLTLLTHLLQEDFLKWKGSLFFRFVTAIVDENKEMQDFSEFCLVHLLMQRHPGMFFQNFVESVFHFNSYDQHQVYNQFNQTDRERRMFSLKGQQNIEKRQKIYRFLLEHMTDEQKFQLTAKLSHDIMGAVVDDVLPMDIDTSALLQDTLTILASKEIKLSSLKTRTQDEIETEQEMAQAVMNAAKKTLISQVMKRNVIENIVPTVIALKHRLEQHRSPVLKDLMLYLRELMKDYKNEVKDFLAADRQLANEIEFDLRKFEEERQKEEELILEKQRREAATPTMLTPAGSPRLQLVQGAGGVSSPKSPRTLATLVNPGGTGTPGRVAGSPGSRTTRAGSPGSRAVGTPARNVSMAAMAMLNSARKAMQQAKQITENRVQTTPNTSTNSSRRNSKPHSPSVQGKTPVLNLGSPQVPKTTKRVAFSQSTDDRDGESTDAPLDGESKDGDSFKTPVRGTRKPASVAQTRAVSTPTGVPGNLTFQGDLNISMIPMSPIPTSMPMRLYEDNQGKGGHTPSWSTKEVEDPSTGRTEQRDVLHMFSPDRPAPKPRVFNVRSPAPFIREKENSPPEKTNNKENQGKKSNAKNNKDTSVNTSRRGSLRSKSNDKNTEKSNTTTTNQTEVEKTRTPTRTARTTRRSLPTNNEKDSSVVDMEESLKESSSNGGGSSGKRVTRRSLQMQNGEDLVAAKISEKRGSAAVSRSGSFRGRKKGSEELNISTTRRSSRSSRT